MKPGHRHVLSAAQQYLALRSNPICPGYGSLKRQKLTWTFEATPSPLSRTYLLRIEYVEGATPYVFVDQPDLVVLADGRKLPHVYKQMPPQLCLYLPSSGEWHPGLLLTATIVPWAELWLLYFEEWLHSDEWKGGGRHPGDEITNPHHPLPRG